MGWKLPLRETFPFTRERQRGQKTGAWPGHPRILTCVRELWGRRVCMKDAFAEDTLPGRFMGAVILQSQTLGSMAGTWVGPVQALPAVGGRQVGLVSLVLEARAAPDRWSQLQRAQQPP